MKKFILLLAFILMAFSCDDDKILQDRIADLEKINDLLEQRIIKLESGLEDTVFVYDDVVIDSLNIFWQNRLTSVNFVMESKIDSLMIEINKLKIDTVHYSESALVRIAPSEVKVDTVVNESLSAEKVIDGVPYISRENKGTRFAAGGYPHTIVFNFAKIEEIDSIYINVFGWNEGFTHTMNIYNYPDTIAAIRTKNVLYSGHELNVKTKQVVLEITGGENSWTDIGEVYFMGKEN